MTNPRFARGALAIVAGNAVRIVLQFTLLPVLARLLGPQDYGIVALAMPIVFFAMIFSEAGLGMALLHAPDESAKLDASAHWFALAIGVLLAGALSALAWPIGAFLSEPRLPPVVVALSAILILGCLSIVPVARLQRQGRMAAIAQVDLWSSLSGMAVALAGAFSGWGAWSLVAQQLTLWGMRAVVSSRISGARIDWAFEMASIRSLFRFSSALVLSRIIGFLSKNLDSFLIGFLLGAVPLGYYVIAFQIIRFPDLLLAGPLCTVCAPVFARHRHSAQATETYIAANRAIATASFPAMAGVALTADLLVSVLLGAKWEPVGHLLRILAPIGAVQCLLSLSGCFLIGLGRSDLQLRLSVMQAGLSITGIVGGVAFGINGVAAGYTAAVLVGAVPCFAASLRQLTVPPSGFFKPLVAPAIATACMGLGVVWLRSRFGGHGALLELFASVSLGVAVYSAVLLMVDRRQTVGDLKVFMAALKR